MRARRLDAVDARQRHVHQHGVVARVRDRIDRRLAGADEIGAMAKLGQDGVEHDAAIGVVLDAEDVQRTQAARAPRSAPRSARRIRRP